MVSSGLLILTQPLTALRGQIPSLLQRVSQVVSDTLYVHLQPIKTRNSNTKFLLSPVPVTSEIRKVVKDIYSIGSTVCRQLDIRVLLSHITNHDLKLAKYPLLREYSLVILDNTPTSNELSEDKGFLLEQVKSLFLTDADVDFHILDPQISSSSSSDLSDDPVLTTYKNVVLGGTFDRLHVGHKILLSEGCMFANKKLTVGISEGKMNDKKVVAELMEPLSVRTSAVEDFIKDIKPTIEPDAVTIFDAYGPTVTDPDFQCIILSDETRKGGAMVNTEREKQGMNRLEQVVIDLVADNSHTPDEDDKVSSSSLRKRLLGALLKPVVNSNVPKSPYRIGLTGGTASGKSSICRRLEGLGAGVVDCDKLGHKAYKPGTLAYDKIKQTFGEDIVGSDGEIDRKKLGGIVFSDRSKLDELNKIVWPEIMKLAEAEISRFQESGKEVVILDAAVLLEAGWNSRVHEVWSAFVPRVEATKRLMERNSLSEEEAVKRLDAQLTNQDRLAQANVTLCTMWEYDCTQRQCEKAWRLLQDRISRGAKL
ncbi:bifunctional coenzyme A synthase-like [Haliotis rufescens]|uniref:bifunctional coenzyme A synthase-like n=1 Tax=Haliotis rufescens TaxID=6454 RepID=UPI00201EB332|nr:bifunctional coenzyme A synthase-like [Haliotis rufescens]